MVTKTLVVVNRKESVLSPLYSQVKCIMPRGNKCQAGASENRPNKQRRERLWLQRLLLPTNLKGFHVN